MTRVFLPHSCLLLSLILIIASLHRPHLYLLFKWHFWRPQRREDGWIPQMASATTLTFIWKMLTLFLLPWLGIAPTRLSSGPLNTLRNCTISPNIVDISTWNSTSIAGLPRVVVLVRHPVPENVGTYPPWIGALAIPPYSPLPYKLLLRACCQNWLSSQPMRSGSSQIGTC